VRHGLAGPGVMKRLRTILSRLNAPLLRDRAERDLALQLEMHVEMLTEDNIRAGIDPVEARRMAQLVLGGIEPIKEECRERWELPWVTAFFKDVFYAVRVLGRNRIFTATAILTLALGIGANTAIFSLLNAVMLRTLPVRDPQQLVLFGKGLATGSTGFLPNESTTLFSYPFYRQLRRDNRVFSDVIATNSTLFGTHGRVAGRKDFEKVNVELVSGNYFHALGVNPIHGRVLADADDDKPGAHPVAVASWSWWQQRLGANPGAIHRTVTMGSTAYTIVGVAPPGFFGLTVGQSPDLWVPLAMEKEISPGWNGIEKNLFQSLHLFARVKPGVSLQQAQADTNFHFYQIMRAFAGNEHSQLALDGLKRARIDLTPAATGRSEIRKQFSSPLKILMAVVALVLLIACANVANLLLGRAAVRQREIAVRLSLGAARARLVGQLLAESGLLALAGGAVGATLGWGGSRLLLALVSTGSETVPLRVPLDLRVFAFTLGITVLTVFVFGVLPALQTTAAQPIGALRGGRGTVGLPARNRLSRGLVIGQVAMSITLLAGAGLFLRTLSNLINIDTGFDKHNVLYTGVDFPAAGYLPDPRTESVMERVEERLNSMPSIHGASFAFFVFNGGGWTTSIKVPGRPESPADPDADLNIVGPRYLDAMKMSIVAGRGLNVRDNMASRKIAVVNETMVRTYFGGVSPIGRTFSIDDDEDRGTEFGDIEVVGIVRDAKYEALDEKPMPAAFFPHAQHASFRSIGSLVARYTGDPAVAQAELRSAIREVDPNLPLGEVTTLERAIGDSVVNKRLAAQLCTFFAALAALLACIGIYGVMSWAVARRTNEFGIRMALGAGRGFVLWTVLRETLRLAIIGAAIGLALALASSRVTSSLLFGIQAYDPFVLTLAILAMIAVAALAGYLPARRATRIDPMAALRYE